MIFEIMVTYEIEKKKTKTKKKNNNKQKKKKTKNKNKKKTNNKTVHYIYRNFSLKSFREVNSSNKNIDRFPRLP